MSKVAPVDPTDQIAYLSGFYGPREGRWKGRSDGLAAFE